MLSPIYFRRLMEGLRDRAGLDLSRLKEFSIEANPATFNLSKAQLWREMGVTRVSMGVQSFDADLLKLLGREHSPDEAAASVAILREAGIPQVNLDLMFSLPGQTIEQWRDSLARAIELKLDHISAYNLSYEEDTEFYRTYGANANNEEEDVAMFCLADEMLSSAGYRHYEISNYAKEGCVSHHNIAYWTGQDYYGLGPGAFGTIDGIRYENVGDTRAYSLALAGDLKQGGKPMEEAILPAGSQEDLRGDTQARRTELLGLSLRMDTGLPADLIREQDAGFIAALCEEGLAWREAQSGAVCLTLRGRLLVDEIATQLM